MAPAVLYRLPADLRLPGRTEAHLRPDHLAGLATRWLPDELLARWRQA